MSVMPELIAASVLRLKPSELHVVQH